MIALFKLPELRAFLISAALASLAESALAVVLGVHVYALTRDAFALGMLGLVEAIPAIGLVLVGGHVADRTSRKTAAVVTRAAMAALAAMLALGGGNSVAALYTIAFFLGTVRAFEEPAVTGLEAEILPRERMMNAVSLVASVGRVAGLSGPVLGGIAYEMAGPFPTFLAAAVLLSLSTLALLLGIKPRAAPARSGTPVGVIAAIAEGVRFVFNSQILIGSMALDLFAVFFGGAAGLFPAFADEVLHEGAWAVGLMRAAASAGALTSMLIATRIPPRARAGLALHLAVAGFGIGIIVFGLSRNLWLCLAALFFVGACDGVSVIIRRAIVRMASPDAMRGRVSSVRGLFLNATNELGTFESGLAAVALGIAPAIWTGGVITLIVAAITAWKAPVLRRLDLREFEKKV
ncbi:MAG: MFS transporter [Alphaproteobacteria bacterium]|nr:MFS transporter [Alphaproteobacteria bacterium]